MRTVTQNIFLLSCLFIAIISNRSYSQCVWTSKTHGQWTQAATWDVSDPDACNATPPAPCGQYCAVTSGVVNIGHNIMGRNHLQIADQFKLNITSGGLLSLRNAAGDILYGLYSGWGSPVFTNAPTGTLTAKEIIWNIGTFNNGGNINLSENFTVEAGTVKLSTGGSYNTAHITAANVNIKNSSSTVAIDGRLNITGNFSTTQSPVVDINYRTTISGTANFSQGQAVTIASGSHFRANSITIHNSATLNVHGIFESQTTLNLGTGTGSSGGSSKIKGSGVVAWNTTNPPGSPMSNPQNSIASDNSSWIECGSGPTIVDAYSGTSGRAWPPNNPLNLSDCGTVPILSTEIVELGAISKGSYIDINWVIISNKKIDEIEIQKNSGPEGSFIPIGLVKVTENNTILNNYTFTDYTPSSTNYYRLKIKDNNGSIWYSKIVTASILKSGISIYPIPIVDGIINVSLDGYNGIANYSVFNTNGEPVTSGELESSQGKPSSIYLNNDLSTGLYFIKISTGADIYREKITIVK